MRGSYETEATDPPDLNATITTRFENPQRLDLNVVLLDSWLARLAVLKDECCRKEIARKMMQRTAVYVIIMV